jgi:site-specific DNA recombinase
MPRRRRPSISCSTALRTLRRAYLCAVIDQVEVDDAEIRIIGRKTVLERLAMGGGSTPSGVPSFVPK